MISTSKILLIYALGVSVALTLVILNILGFFASTASEHPTESRLPKEYLPAGVIEAPNGKRCDTNNYGMHQDVDANGTLYVTYTKFNSNCEYVQWQPIEVGKMIEVKTYGNSSNRMSITYRVPFWDDIPNLAFGDWPDRAQDMIADYQASGWKVESKTDLGGSYEHGKRIQVILVGEDVS